MATGMVGSYMLATRKSAYHDSCIPADKRLPEPSTDKKHSNGDFAKCDNVTQDTIWKQSVGKEKRCLKSWETNWGFLTEYDSKGQGKTMGNQIEVEPLPEKTSIFSENVPNTNSGNYGARVQSSVGVQMQQMEHQFYSSKRRKKLGKDLVCY